VRFRLQTQNLCLYHRLRYRCLIQNQPSILSHLSIHRSFRNLIRRLAALNRN
jgi:hypothetical protein